MPREVALKDPQIGARCFVPLSDAWAQRRFIVCCRLYDELSTAARLLFDFLASREPPTGAAGGVLRPADEAQ